MKIRELIEIKLDVPTSSKEITGLINSPGLKPLGAGWQALAYGLKSRPGTVVKTTNITGENDPVFQFIRVAKNHQDNPFFPRIGKIKMYATKRIPDDERDEQMLEILPGKFTPEFRDYMLVYVTEELIPTDTLPEEQVRDIIINLINTNSEKPLRQFVSMLFQTKKNRAILRNRSKNEYFTQALRLLEPLFSRFHPDVHLGNVMFRKSGDSYQLVFIDPLSDLWDDD
jgi:hypothetical protein